MRRAGKACLIAKGSRIPADWARHPWLAHFAFQAGHSCTVSIGAGFCGNGSELGADGERARAGMWGQTGAVCLGRKGLP